MLAFQGTINTPSVALDTITLEAAAVMSLTGGSVMLCSTASATMRDGSVTRGPATTHDTLRSTPARTTGASAASATSAHTACTPPLLDSANRM